MKFRRMFAALALVGLAAACGGSPEPATTVTSEGSTLGPVGAVSVTRDVVADLEDRYTDMDR